MNKAILSDKYPEFSEKLRESGFDTVSSEQVSCFIPYERDHADMQCLIINDTAFVLDGCHRVSERLSESYRVINCGESVGAKYPCNVALNAALVGNKLICRKASLDDTVKKYCDNNSIEIINVRQGYAKCSCAIVSDNAVITADKGIYRALQYTGIETLLIGEGSIRLEGAEYGFIGGASGYYKDNNTLYFCGNIKNHPDYEKIKGFCNRKGTNIISLSACELTDIGGIIFC